MEIDRRTPPPVDLRFLVSRRTAVRVDAKVQFYGAVNSPFADRILARRIFSAKDAKSVHRSKNKNVKK